MHGKDLKNKLIDIIKEEVRILIDESSGKVSSLADPKKMDPNDPEIYVKGFGTYTRSALRLQIANRLKTIADTAKKAAAGGPMAAAYYKNLDGNLIYQSTDASTEKQLELEFRKDYVINESIAMPEDFFS